MTTPAGFTGDGGAQPGDEDSGLGGVIDLGDGNTLVFNDGAVKELLVDIRHAPAVIGMLDAKAQGMAAAANSYATVPGADYEVTVVSAWPGSSRARANVWTANAAAARDEAQNSTLLKVLASFGGG